MNIIKKRKKLRKKLGKRKKKERRETKSDMIYLFLLYTFFFLFKSLQNLLKYSLIITTKSEYSMKLLNNKIEL
jgi:polyferredoxin